MEHPSFAYSGEAIEKIPADYWWDRFGSEENWRNAASRLTGKIYQFPKETKRIERPLSGQYLYENWGDLCHDIPWLICSIAQLGKDDPSQLFPPDLDCPNDSIIPDWGRLGFELIEQAEQLYQSCREDFTEYFQNSSRRQEIYNPLFIKIERFRDTEHLGDLRHIYWLLYLEMRFTLDWLYPSIHRNERVFEYSLATSHPEHWLALRGHDIQVLPLVHENTSYLIPDFDQEKYIIFREEVHRIARRVYLGPEGTMEEHTNKTKAVHTLLDRLRSNQEYKLTAEDQELIADKKSFPPRRAEYLAEEGITDKYDELLQTLYRYGELSVEDLCAVLQWPLVHSRIILGSFMDYARKTEAKTYVKRKVTIETVRPNGQKETVKMIILG